MRAVRDASRNARTSSPGFQGAATARASCFLSHTDVVLADPSEWSADPFGGELRDGEVWGRGALDMKGQVAAERGGARVACTRGLRAERRPDLRRDGRRGGRRRLRRAVAVRGASGRDPVRLLINEGGRRPDRARRTARSTSARSAEKMSAPFRLRVLGRSGHASMPGIADNALVKAAPADRRRWARTSRSSQLEPEVVALVETVTGEAPTSPDDALERARAVVAIARGADRAAASR